MTTLRKFSSQAEPKLLDELQKIARREGRQFQAVLGEALREYVASRQQQKPRRNVLEAFEASVRERDALYRRLAE